MKIIVAFDSFKGCIGGYEASCQVAAFLRRHGYQAEALPLADGGEGTAQALRILQGGENQQVTTVDAYGNPCRAEWVLLPSGAGVTDMSACCGLGNAEGSARARVMEASTFGVGLMLRHMAQTPGVAHIRLGLGGSASCDGGVGLLQALGVKLHTRAGLHGHAAGRHLLQLTDVDTADMIHLPEVELLCDVSSPLCGDDGAARRYAPQKGATLHQVEILESGLRHWAGIIAAKLSVDPADLMHKPGMGAAGGLPLAALLAGWKIGNGARYVAGKIMPHALGADVIITGEGRSDASTLLGKAPYTLMSMARRADIPVLLISGAITIPAGRLLDAGFASCEAVSPKVCSPYDMLPDITIKRLCEHAFKSLQTNF